MCAIVCEAEAENKIVFGDKIFFWINDNKPEIKWKKITTKSVKTARDIADVF